MRFLSAVYCFCIFVAVLLKEWSIIIKLFEQLWIKNIYQLIVLIVVVASIVIVMAINVNIVIFM